MKTLAMFALVALLTLTVAFAPNRSTVNDTRFVSFDVSVTDKNGNPVAGLVKSNFKVYENDLEQSVTAVSAARKPLAVVVVVELSEAAIMTDGIGPVEDLLNRLDAKDWGALVAFGSRADIVVDFTHDKTGLLDGFRRLYTRVLGDAALFDTLSFVLDRMKNLDQKRGILLLSTGQDTMSFNRSFGQVLRRAETSDTMIYSVNMATPIQGMVPFSDYEEQFELREAQSMLRSLAESSGGLAFEPQFGRQYSLIGGTVVSDLRNQYTLTFASTSPGVAGKLRKLRVEVVGTDTDHNGKPDKLKIRHKRGY
jgi:VWFA-related protein